MSGVVQVKLIGGFGNQLHQYAACRKYAESVGAELEVQDWVGRDLFALHEREWSRELPEVNDGACGSPPALEWGQTGVRLGGYFQSQPWVGRLSRSELRRWFTFRPDFLEVCRDAVPKGSYTAAHLRQGDYIGHPLYANVPERSYLRACAARGLGIDAWARQDAPRRVPGLSDRFHFLPDFLVLTRASVLLRANSTFSWWAAALSDADVYAPVVGAHVGEFDADFVRGNWPRCAHTDRVGPVVDDLYLPD